MPDYSPVSFALPPIVKDLVAARNHLRTHYKIAGLEFTFDGKLVGDIGEAVAAEIFGLRLSSETGIDGYLDDLSVQVKATGRGLGPAFRYIDKRADHLLFLDINFDECTGIVVFNGPEKIALRTFPDKWVGQRSLTKKQIRVADQLVEERDRLQPCAAYQSRR